MWHRKFEIDVLVQEGGVMMGRSFAWSLSGGNRGPAAQFDDHLLAVVKSTFVPQLLKSACSICQHPHPLAWGRQERRRQIPTCQHGCFCLLTLAWPCLTLLCTHTHTHDTEWIPNYRCMLQWILNGYTFHISGNKLNEYSAHACRHTHK